MSRGARVLVLTTCLLTTLACGGLSVPLDEEVVPGEGGFAEWTVPGELERRLEREGLQVESCSVLDADTVVAEGVLCSFVGDVSGSLTWHRFVSADAAAEVEELSKGGALNAARRMDGLVQVSLLAVGGDASRVALGAWVDAEPPAASAAWVEAAAGASGWTVSCEEMAVAGNTMVLCDASRDGTKGSVTVLQAPTAGDEGWVESDVGATYRRGRAVVTLALTEVGPPEGLLDALLAEDRPMDAG